MSECSQCTNLQCPYATGLREARLQTKIPASVILLVGFVGIALIYLWAKREEK